MRKILAMGTAAVTLAAAVLVGSPSQAVPPDDTTRRVGDRPAPTTPAPEAGADRYKAQIAKPYQPVAPDPKAKRPKADRPDFGPHEKIVRAYHRGQLSLDDAVRYGTMSVDSPASVPARLRPTGAIEDPATYLTYLSMLSASATPATSRAVTPTLAAPTATAAGYDDCAAEDYEYIGVTYKCRASAGEFLILYNVAGGGQPGVPADYNPNGRAKAVQYMLNSLSMAVSEYRAMGYPLPVRADKPYVLVYGVNSILGQPNTAPFVLPFGLNQQPTILVPTSETRWDYMPRHELFHVMQYQYWDKSSVSLDFLWQLVGGKEFGSMNWWMESTAEWAAHQTYVRTGGLSPLSEHNDYARNVSRVLRKPGQALNSWGGLGEGSQYGSFLLPAYLTERTDGAFVRRTWENVRNHDHLPIEAIRKTVEGYSMNFKYMLLDYHIANYRLTKANAAPPPDVWGRYGYQDPDAHNVWRTFLYSYSETADDGLGDARPARKKHTVPAGTHTEYHDILRKGGAVYHDFWAKAQSGDPDCGYCSTLMVDTTKDPNRSSAIIVWSPKGSPGNLAEYPTIETVKYPDAGGLITVSNFAYPMVATLVTTWTELDIHSQDADDSPKTFDTYMETTLPLKERSCALRAPNVTSRTLNVAPESTFNSYAATTRDGWTGGDSTYSVKLPDGRIIWLFSDTWLGPLNSNGTRPTTAPLVNNTFVVQNGNSLTTYHGGTAGAPRPIMGPTSTTTWYWIGDGHLSGGQLQVVFQEYLKFGPGGWDFRFNRNVVADFDLSNLHAPVRVRDLPSASGVAWGSALLPASRSGDGYTYIYGVDDSPTHKQMRIARVQGSDLASGTWQYYTPWGWTFREQNARNMLTGIANEYSVTPWNGQYLLLSQDSTEAFSGRIMAYTSCSPFGPFHHRTEVYRMPEPGPYGSYWNPNVISYNAHVHASLSSGNTFVASYNVNSMDTRVSPEGDHYRDPGIYRPRFFRFTLG
ncbi:hypothetical protein GCM10011608_43200 [Micromonospora sonchi]|uniref:DUF4185 domain-containing protein n=1 Tax=Micromonospora sonchi TaxID=1763543 RepID=A0A917U440_9ACTN|nr:DUF4185 domain-containing protein [Micromonospora sonchi]GGM53663.1 hypothetical protein GCM10011608_43200 [Micromonospora sonchi]